MPINNNTDQNVDHAFTSDSLCDAKLPLLSALLLSAACGQEDPLSREESLGSAKQTPLSSQAESELHDNSTGIRLNQLVSEASQETFSPTSNRRPHFLPIYPSPLHEIYAVWRKTQAARLSELSALELDKSDSHTLSDEIYNSAQWSWHSSNHYPAQLRAMIECEIQGHLPELSAVQEISYPDSAGDFLNASQIRSEIADLEGAELDFSPLRFHYLIQFGFVNGQLSMEESIEYLNRYLNAYSLDSREKGINSSVSLLGPIEDLVSRLWEHLSIDYDKAGSLSDSHNTVRSPIADKLFDLTWKMLGSDGFLDHESIAVQDRGDYHRMYGSEHERPVMFFTLPYDWRSDGSIDNLINATYCQQFILHALDHNHNPGLREPEQGTPSASIAQSLAKLAVLHFSIGELRPDLEEIGLEAKHLLGLPASIRTRLFSELATLSRGRALLEELLDSDSFNPGEKLSAKCALGMLEVQSGPEFYEVLSLVKNTDLPMVERAFNTLRLGTALHQTFHFNDHKALIYDQDIELELRALALFNLGFYANRMPGLSASEVRSFMREIQGSDEPLLRYISQWFDINWPEANRFNTDTAEPALGSKELAARMTTESDLGLIAMLSEAYINCKGHETGDIPSLQWICQQDYLAACDIPAWLDINLDSGLDRLFSLYRHSEYDTYEMVLNENATLPPSMRQVKDLLEKFEDLNLEALLPNHLNWSLSTGQLSHRNN